MVQHCIPYPNVTLTFFKSGTQFCILTGSYSFQDFQALLTKLTKLSAYTAKTVFKKCVNLSLFRSKFCSQWWSQGCIECYNTLLKVQEPHFKIPAFTMVPFTKNNTFCADIRIGLLLNHDIMKNWRKLYSGITSLILLLPK